MTTELTDEQWERIKEESNIMSLDVDSLQLDTLEHPEYVHKDRLRELVEWWREKAKHTEAFEESFGRGLEMAYGKAADELEAVINDE